MWLRWRQKIMNKIEKWLFSNPVTTLKGRAFNVVGVVGALFIWSFFVKWFLNFLYGYPIFQIFPSFFPPEPKVAFLFFGYCIATPFIEEAMFRYAPIEISRQISHKAILPAVILSTIVFAQGHSVPWIYAIMMQGVGGLAFSFLYIKNGFSYLSSVSAHALWNFLVIFLVK